MKDELTSDHWKKLQDKKVFKSDPLEKKVNNLRKAMTDPDGYNTNLASKERVEKLEEVVDELAASVNFEEKLNQLNNKMDFMQEMLANLSNRVDNLMYNGQVEWSDPYNVGRYKKIVKVNLKRKEQDTPNPYGDDDFATPIE